MNRQHGWSLLETLICITLSATLAWAAIPRPDARQLATDAGLLSEVLRAIRQRAIMEGKEFVVAYQSGICSVSPQQAGLVGLCKKLRAPNPQTIVFYPNGVSSPTTLTLTDGSQSICTVAISIKGRMRVSCGELGATR